MVTTCCVVSATMHNYFIGYRSIEDGIASEDAGIVHARVLDEAASQLTRDGELRDRLAKLAASWKHEQGGEPRKFCLMLKEQRLDPAIEMYRGCEAYRGPTCDACRAMDDAADELLAAMEETTP